MNDFMPCNNSESAYRLLQQAAVLAFVDRMWAHGAPVLGLKDDGPVILRSHIPAHIPDDDSTTAAINGKLSADTSNDVSSGSWSPSQNSRAVFHTCMCLKTN